MKHNRLLFPFLIATTTVQAQTPTNEEVLEEIVIYEQRKNENVQKEVAKVKTISAEEIKNMAAVNLAEVLSLQANMSVITDETSGKTTISLLGLDAKYFKILIDNVPVVSDEGVGNNVDLSQIQLDNIEKIELIEGAMGVTHGANAIGGVLNIITKKNSRHLWEINTYIQEESLRNEYNLKNKGRHIQNLRISRKIGDQWLISVGGNRDHSFGLYGDFFGKNHQYNDGKRGYKWLPSEKYNAFAFVNYQNENNLKINYRINYFQSDVNSISKNVIDAYNSNLGSYKYGNDQIFQNKNIQHLLNINYGNSNDWAINSSVSYQKQTRNIEKYRYIITTQRNMNFQSEKNREMDVFYTKTEFDRTLNNGKLHAIIGNENIISNGFAWVDKELNKKAEVNKNINNYDIYSLLIYRPNLNWSLSGGGRYSIQSIFKNQWAVSFHSTKNFKNNYEWKIGLGKSYRTPEFDELYSRIIFEGHHFVGNENLLPERSISVDTHLNKTFTFSTPLHQISSGISANMLNIKDRISTALIGFDGAIPMYEMMNVNSYQSFHLSTKQNYSYGQFNVGLGASFVWISQLIDNKQFATDNRYLFNNNANAQISYRIPKWKSQFNVFYNLIGKSQSWRALNDGYYISQVSPYGLMDISLRKQLFNNQWELTLGVRNVLNNEEIIYKTQYKKLLLEEKVRRSSGRNFFFRIAYNFKNK